MNAYTQLEVIKKELIQYNFELMDSLKNNITDISVKKVQARILNMLREV